MDKIHVAMYYFDLMAWKPSFTRYLTVNQRALDWQLYCTSCGCAETPPGASYPPFPQSHPARYTKNLSSGRIIEEYQLVYISKGEGAFRTELAPERQVRAGQVLVLFPDIRHSYQPDPDSGWDEYWVGFAGPYADRLKEAGFLDEEEPVLDVGYSEPLLHEYIRVFEIATEQQPGFQLELASAIIAILAKILATMERAQQHSESQQLVDRAKLLMEEHVLGELDLESLTHELGICYHKFLGHFKQYTGLTPYQYFLQLKIHHAKQLLRDTRHSVQDVAYQLNFEDQFYFSRLFKKKTGISPTDWQRSETFEMDER